jgi:pimeloyl-ACP methyl ester carboxylesterase
MSAILLDGGIVHYEVIGRGRPIIFLHGWVGSWRYWIPAMQTASTSFRAYAVDMWGFGESAHETTRYGLDQQASLLDHFLQEMGIGKVALVGHGLGALVGLSFAMRYPAIVDRIMAVDAPLNLDAVNSRLRSSTLPDLVEWLLSKDPVTEPARTDGVKSDPLAVSASFNSPDAFNLSGRISSLNTACLLVYGQNDPAITIPAFDLDSAPSMMQTVILDQTGHFPMLDDSPRFNRLLNDFLALESGESPRDLQLKEEWKRRVR